MEKLKNNVLLKIISHIIVWLVVFALPFLLSSEEKIKWDIFSNALWSPILFAVIIFYINYFFLIDKFFVKKKYLVFVLLNILIITIFVILLDIFRSVNMPSPPDFGNNNFPRRPPGGHSMFLMFAFKDFVTLAIPIIFCIAIKVTRKLVNTERERQIIEKENLQSTLMLLKYQVQPHFFFNSLNNIYALIESSPKDAQEALYNLGKLMRYLLYEKEIVELDEEIEFLKKYISLMELRLRNNIKFTASFPENIQKYQIAPLLMVPLIENAFKHGISSTENSVIIIDMKIINNCLHFLVENTYFPKDKSDKSGSGIGLQNLKQRLEMIYKGKYQLLLNIENSIYRTELIIDLKKNVT